MSTNRGPTTIEVTGGKVETLGTLDGSGNAPIGMLAEALEATGKALITVNGTTVSTTANNAAGIMSYTASFSGGRVPGGARIEAPT